MERKDDLGLKDHSIDEILVVMKRKDYVIFMNDSKPYNLNLIGVRSKDPTPNVFNDRLYVIYFYKGAKVLKHIKLTTDPGLYWLLNPMNVDGTAILKPGQYLNCWKLGLHQGKYEALVQCGPMTVIRDFNRDNVLDYDTGKEETGLFGINFHHAGENSTQVDKWSAGCQVAAILNEYWPIIEDCKKARDNWGNHFSYTLLLETDFDEVLT